MKKLLLILLCLPMIGFGQEIENKKIVLGGSSSFSFQNSFENDNFNASSNFLIDGSVGFRLSNYFLVGGRLSFVSLQSNSISNKTILLGPFLRGYLNDAYFFLGYDIGGNTELSGSVFVNPSVTSSVKTGFGYQIFLNESVSLNPSITYFNNKYKQIHPYYYQTGILFGFGFELHL